MMVKFVSKETLFPKFGFANMRTRTAFVRDDLPGHAKRFVKFHEIYHLSDAAKWWVWREIKANAYAAWREPLGFLQVVAMSLQPYRIWYYITRFRKGE